MRLGILVAWSGISLCACSTASPQSSETLGSSVSSASNSDGTSDPAGQTTGASSASTDAPTTTLDPATGPGTATQATTSAATSAGTTSETGTGAPGTTTAGETTESGTTESGTSESGGTTTNGTTSEGTTGGLGGGPCEVDADCKLHDDCCSCYAIPVGQDDPVCNAQCDQTQCQKIGIDTAECVFGQCVTEKVDCSGQVACDELPPDCPAGTLPGVAEDLCWSGACVPVISCWTVPACDLCPDSFMCVNYDNVFGGDRRCLPRPAACDGEVDCECAGEACDDIFELCVGGGVDADLVCDCPNC